MLNVRETVERKYWSITKVAEIFGCATSKIRYWEYYFELKIKRKRKGKNGKYFLRQFTEHDVHDLTIIHDLVETQGYKLYKAKEHFYEDRTGTTSP